MNEDLANIQYSPILDYKYARFFEEVQYNGKTLSDAERKELVAVIDETIAQYSEGLPMMYDTLESIKDQHDEYHEIDRTVVSVMQFVLITMIDSMVASKYFIFADEDYDRRFMRGKLMVILNEGFKRLYGFDDKTHKKSEWDRLLPLMGRFPEVINRQYQELTYHLEKHAKSSSWWKEKFKVRPKLEIYISDYLQKSATEEDLNNHIDIADGDPDFEAPFYLLKYTYAAAVLTENGFMDSEVSLAFLESDEGKNAIIALHVDGIENFIIRRSHEPL